MVACLSTSAAEVVALLHGVHYSLLYFITRQTFYFWRRSKYQGARKWFDFRKVWLRVVEAVLWRRDCGVGKAES